MTEMKNKKDYENYMDKVVDYVLIFWCIASIIFFVLFLLQQKNKNYQNVDTTISAHAKTINDISNYDNVSDLTGTSWVFDMPDKYIGMLSPNTFYLNINYNNNSYTKLYFDNDDYNLGGLVYSVTLYNNSYNDGVSFAIEMFESSSNILNQTWEIIGGTDATNSTLISWLQANATLQQSQPIQLTTPVLSSTLVVQSGVDLYWTYDSSISTPYNFEIYKDDTLLTTTNSSFYTITSNGTYKVKQIGDNNSFMDSEFSNSVTISGLTHFSLTLDNGVSSLTTYSLNGISFVSEPINYTNFYLLLDSNFNTQFYPIIYFSIYNTNDNTINGTKLDNGYVFASENDISSLSDIEYYSHLDNYQLLYFRLTELDTNIVNISVTSHNAKLITGNTYIYDKQLSNYDLSTGDYLLKDKPFTSNDNDYDNIFVNNYNYLVYDNNNTAVNDTTYFLSNLTGQYISNSTYNYMLVTIGSDYIQNSLIKDYLSTDDVFFDFYRLATQSDFDNIQALNNQLVNINENYTFLSLFGSIIDAHFNTIKSLINFNFFGINLWSIFTLFLTLTLVFIVFKFLRGGGKKE